MSTISDALAAAVRHHQAGQLQQAEQLYRQILQENPRQPDALHLLGALAHQVGNNEVAVELIRNAIAAEPTRPAFHSTLATVYQALDRLDEAVESCQRALQIKPDYVEGLNNLGLAYQTQGKLKDAAEAYRRALRVRPDYVEALNNLGSAFQHIGKPEEAEEHFRRALRYRPEYVEAHNNLANALKDQGRLDEAVASYRRALEIRPDFAEIHNNLAMALQDQGKTDEAVAAFGQALQIRPGYAEAHNNLGQALLSQAALDEAVTCFQRAVQIQSDYAEAVNNLGHALKAMGRLDQAAGTFQRALQIRPDFVEALSNLGAICREQEKLDEAVAYFRKALEIDPAVAEVHNNLAGALYEQGCFEEAKASFGRALEIRPKESLWELRIATLFCPPVFDDTQAIEAYRRRLVEDFGRFRKKDLHIDPARLSVFGGVPPFGLQYQGKNDRPIKEAYAEIFRGRFPEANRSVGGQRPRVGFLVTHGHEGIFLRFMQGTLEHFDPERIEPVVVCSRAGAAELRAAIRSDAVSLLTISERLDHIVEAIGRAGIDVLYYWEVGTDAINYFLPFFRPAPVQCTSWGIPVTSGIPQMDHYLSSELLETDAAAEHYSEELVRLATLPTYYYRSAAGQGARTRADFGLPDDRHLYLCPHNLYKFHPDFDRPMAEILRGDPQGEIVLVEASREHVTRSLQRRLRRTMPEGLDRVRFVSRQSRSDFVALLGLADVLLDPLHFGGGNTTYEAFSRGVPIVTLPSEFMRGRVTAACYRKMGVADCVAADRDDYVKIALKLGTDADYRETVRSKVGEAAETLFEDAAAVRQLEEFFLRAAEQRRTV
ncbi:MAG: tetratricopeptide repeat protein [Pirellulales bacterium]|nr:tetratricopeptide repeat protein [Pirellulales bacterium]